MALAVSRNAIVVFYEKSRTAALPYNQTSHTTPPHVPVLSTSVPQLHYFKIPRIAHALQILMGPLHAQKPQRRSPPVDIACPDPPNLVTPPELSEGPLSASDQPALRRSARYRRPALEFDRAFGQWVVKGSNS